MKLLDRLAARGIEVTLDKGTVVVRPASLVTANERDLLRLNRERIVAFLSGEDAPDEERLEPVPVLKRKERERRVVGVQRSHSEAPWEPIFADPEPPNPWRT